MTYRIETLSHYFSIMGTSFVLLWLFAWVAAEAGVSTPPPGGTAARAPAELFKEFFANPPTIADWFYSEDDPGGKTMWVHHLKWQTNALFVATVAFADTADNEARIWALSDVTDVDKFSHIESQFWDKYWFRGDNGLTTWTNRGIAEEKVNEMLGGYEDKLNIDLPRGLHFGCIYVPLSGFHWRGDQFRCTNAFHQIWVEGNLSRDGSNRAGALTVHYGPIPHATKKSIGVGVATYKYYYNTTLSLPFLPSRIEEVGYDDISGSKRVYERVYVVRSISVTGRPSGIDAFALDPARFSHLDVLAFVSKGKIVTYDPKGIRPTQIRDDSAYAALRRRPQVNRVYFTLMAALLLVPVIVLWLSRRKIPRPTTQLH